MRILIMPMWSLHSIPGVDASPDGEKLFYYRNLYPVSYMREQLTKSGLSVIKQDVFPDKDGEAIAYIRAIKFKII